MSELQRIDISELDAFLLGQAQDLTAMTGCTAIIAPKGAVCGVDIRGGSPATRDVSALDPLCNRKEIHGIMLAGGSSFGLEAAGGLVGLLEEKGIGRNVGVTVVPNVPSAVLFDLKCGSSTVRPDAGMGRAAGENAFAKLPFQSGNFGAGTGASVGTFKGMEHSMKGGIGAAAFSFGKLKVGAVFAVNCIGDIVENGQIIAGMRQADGVTFADSERVILSEYHTDTDFFSEQNTVIGCVLTNAGLSKVQAAKLAALGQNGIARSVYPANTIFDGDTVFALCSGEVSATLDAVGIIAAKAVQVAIYDAVKSAESCGCVMSYSERLSLVGK